MLLLLPKPAQAAPAAPAEPVESGSVFDVYLARMEAIYAKHAPSKKASVRGFLTRSPGEEHDLYLKVCKKYNITPKPQYVGGQAAPAASAASSAQQPPSEWLMKPGEQLDEAGLIKLMTRISTL